MTNVTAPATGSSFGTRTIAAVEYPYSIPGTVVAGAFTEISAAAPMPVSIAAMPSTPVTGTFWQATQPVNGTVTVGNASLAITAASLPALSGTTAVSIAALPALTAGSAAIGSVSVSNLPATQPISAVSLPALSGTTAVSLATLPALATGANTIGAVNVIGTVPVSGTVAVTGAYQVTQPVSGTVAVTGAYQATQPVSIAAMPSTPVTGTFFQTTQPVSIASMPSTPVTGTFFQTTQPVSGTVAVTGTATVTPVDAPNLNVGQITVAATATQIVAARAGRRTLTVITESTTAVRMGGSGVTVGTGILLPGTANTGFTLNGFTGALYGITATGTEAVSFIETY